MNMLANYISSLYIGNIRNQKYIRKSGPEEYGKISEVGIHTPSERMETYSQVPECILSCGKLSRCPKQEVRL